MCDSCGSKIRSNSQREMSLRDKYGYSARKGADYSTSGTGRYRSSVRSRSPVRRASPTRSPVRTASPTRTFTRRPRSPIRSPIRGRSPIRSRSPPRRASPTRLSTREATLGSPRRAHFDSPTRRAAKRYPDLSGYGDRKVGGSRAAGVL